MELFAKQKLRDLVALLVDKNTKSEMHPSIRKSLVSRFSRLDADLISRDELADKLLAVFRQIGDEGYFPHPPENDYIMQWMLRLHDELTNRTSK